MRLAARGCAVGRRRATADRQHARGRPMTERCRSEPGAAGTILSSAGAVTAARQGWVLEPRGRRVSTVVAAIGAGDLVGTRRAGRRRARPATCLASGQPMAMMPASRRPGRHRGRAGRAGDPSVGVLCVPCAYDDEVRRRPGAGGQGRRCHVQLRRRRAVDRAGQHRRLGHRATRGRRCRCAPADELAAELRQLSAADPATYVRVATVLEALLARG